MRQRRPSRPPPAAALVTGASSGIGAAFASELPTTTRLVLVGRDEDRLNATAAPLMAQGRSVTCVIADLATDAGRNTTIDAAEAAEVDLLINNAGLGRFGAVLDNDPRAERATVEVNVVTPLVLTRALVPGMLDRAEAAGRRAGVIILSSGSAFAPTPYLTTYAATKAFDLYLALGLAEELRGQPVDVLCVCPGPTQSRFGGSAGFDRDHLPGAIPAETVARQSLAALGRRAVLVTGRAHGPALTPFGVAASLAARGLGLVTRRFLSQG